MHAYRITKNEKSIEEIVLGGQHWCNSACGSVMVRHPSCGTEENPSDAGKFKTKINVLINRAPVQKKLRETAGLGERSESDEAVTGTQPLHRRWTIRHGVVSEA